MSRETTHPDLALTGASGPAAIAAPRRAAGVRPRLLAVSQALGIGTSLAISIGAQWLLERSPGNGALAAALFGAASILAVWATWNRSDDAWPEWTPTQLWLACAAIAAVALTMRLAMGLQRIPAFVEADEAEVAMAAQNLFTFDPRTWFGFWEANPAMRLMPAHISGVMFGPTLWGVRFGNAILGTLGVLAFFGGARRLLGNFPGFVAALLLATTHAHVHWSRQAAQYINTPVAAAVILWLLMRIWTPPIMLRASGRGGEAGFFTWTGLVLALGIGTQTYQASFVLPVALAVTLVGWAVLDVRSHAWGRVSHTYFALMLVLAASGLVLLPLLPMIVSDLYHAGGSRLGTLFIFAPVNWSRLGGESVCCSGDGTHPYRALLQHAVNTLTMFNVGRDFYPNYAAPRSMLDAVTAAFLPVTAALLLSRIATRVGWMCLTWIALYLVAGVFLCAHPPAYERVPTTLLFTSIGIVWALCLLLGTFGRRVAIIGCLLVAIGSGMANAYFYFHTYRLAQPHHVLPADCKEFCAGWSDT